MTPQPDKTGYFSLNRNSNDPIMCFTRSGALREISIPYVNANGLTRKSPSTNIYAEPELM